MSVKMLSLLLVLMVLAGCTTVKEPLDQSTSAIAASGSDYNKYRFVRQALEPTNWRRF